MHHPVDSDVGSKTLRRNMSVFVFAMPTGRLCVSWAFLVLFLRLFSTSNFRSVHPELRTIGLVKRTRAEVRAAAATHGVATTTYIWSSCRDELNGLEHNHFVVQSRSSLANGTSRKKRDQSEQPDAAAAAATAAAVRAITTTAASL